MLRYNFSTNNTQSRLYTSRNSAIKAGTFVRHSSVHLQICCITDKLGAFPIKKSFFKVRGFASDLSKT